MDSHNHPLNACVQCDYLPEGPLRCTHPSGDGVPGHVCPLGKFDNVPVVQRPKSVSIKQVAVSDLCKYLQRGGCCNPSHCTRLPGTPEVTLADCEKCEMNPAKPESK